MAKRQAATPKSRSAERYQHPESKLMLRPDVGTQPHFKWEHLAGTTSTPFEAGRQRQIAVKVIDDRGDEMVLVKKLSE